SLGQKAMAVLDRDGVYGAPRFHFAAKEEGIQAHIGTEITMSDGSILPLLVKSRTGYQNLCRLITRIKMRSPKGEGAAMPNELAEFSEGLVCLAGADDGILSHSFQNNTADKEIQKRLLWLIDIYGKENIYVELQRHYDRNQEARNKILLEAARRIRLPILATNGACYDTPARRELYDVLTCIREKVTLANAGKLLARNSERYLKSSRAMNDLFVDLPEAIHNTIELSSRL